MWLGEQINTYGIGNGSSMIIFAGIVASMPQALFTIFENVRLGQTDILMVALLAFFALLLVGCIIFLERGERKVPVQYAKRVVGRKVFGGQTAFIPLKLNPAGVVPVIFAQALMGMPMTIAGFLAAYWPALNRLLMDWFYQEKLFYNVVQSGLIIFFAFFYTAIIFNPAELAELILENQVALFLGFVQGVKPQSSLTIF